MDKLKEKISGLRMEAEEANMRADEAAMRVKHLEHELTLKEQENIGLIHKNDLLEMEIERLEQQLMEAKTAAEDDSGNRNISESLQKKIQLLEEELEISDMNLRKTTDKLRQMDVKSEHFERKVSALEKEHIHKHTEYHLRHLDFLPDYYLFTDTSRMSMAFFCISSLDLLGSLEKSTTPLQRKSWVNWVYSFQVSNGFCDWTKKNQYSPMYHDLVHIASTYFAICILLILKDDMKRLNRKNIMQFVSCLQNENGSFRPYISNDQNIQSFEKADIRFTYCAIAVLYVLGCKDARKIIRVESLLKYIESCKSYDHGFAENPKNESHAGYTYCAIASLSLLKNMLPTENKKISSMFSEKTLKWLLKKQLSDIEDFGGFQGRTNKSSDTCYSFWVGGALRYSREFLLKRIHSTGGFEKCKGEYPDVMHSYFGLAALSIFGDENLEEIDPALGVTKKSLENLNILYEY
ncbi:hypothetical protein PCANB_000950 [Pneumocystis canis]|nr:hypothetical protein PCANB_000950 [Pneumocystis canis]